MKEEREQNKTEQREFFIFGKIPLIALIFPPIGFVMLLNYILTKRTKE